MMNAELVLALRQLSEDPGVLKAMHQAMEDELIEWRDAGRFVFPCANGLSVSNRDGSLSGIIRIPTAMAARMMLEFAADHLEKKEP